MGIYAMLGVGQALASFINGVIFAMLIYASSRQLHKDAIYRVLHAPMSFFETTPVGRIMNRFSKDIDTMDNMLAGAYLYSISYNLSMKLIYLFCIDAFRMFLNTFSSIVGAVILISIVLPWFLIAVGAVCVMYIMAAAFYRASARELKVWFKLLQLAWLLIISIVASGCHSSFVSVLALLRVVGRPGYHPCLW
jgi:ABC-type multidrug transport system fused ATPase/permease subunit